MVQADEPAPTVGTRVLCRHPFHEARRGWAEPHEIRPLYKLYWANGRIAETLPSFAEIRENALQSVGSLRQDYKRNLNPTPYKVINELINSSKIELSCNVMRLRIVNFIFPRYPSVTICSNLFINSGSRMLRLENSPDPQPRNLLLRIRNSPDIPITSPHTHQS